MSIAHEKEGDSWPKQLVSRVGVREAPGESKLSYSSSLGAADMEVFARGAGRSPARKFERF